MRTQTRENGTGNRREGSTGVIRTPLEESWLEEGKRLEADPVVSGLTVRELMVLWNTSERTVQRRLSEGVAAGRYQQVMGARRNSVGVLRQQLVYVLNKESGDV